MTIAIYTLTSELHDEQAVGAVTQEFLDTKLDKQTLSIHGSRVTPMSPMTTSLERVRRVSERNFLRGLSGRQSI